MKLSQLCEAIIDCEHKTAPAQAVGIPSIRTTDIKNGRLDLQNSNRVSEETYKEWTARLEPRADDLILAREAPVGEVGIIPEGQRVCLGQRTVLIRANKQLVNPRFLLYLLITPRLKHEILSRAEGSVVPHLNVADIRALELPHLPSLPIQNSIATILGALDDKIELNRRMNETLEAIARALFTSWFVDFDPVRAKMEGREPAGMDAETAALFPNSFSQSLIGLLPTGWTVGQLSDLCLNPRRTVDPMTLDPAIPYIGLEHMPRKSIALPEWSFAGNVESHKSCFLTGEILFGKLRPYFHKVGVAPIDGVCSTDILVIAPRADEWFALVLLHLSSDRFIERMSNNSTGTRMPRANWNDVAKYTIAMPPPTVARTLNERVLPLVERMRNHVMQTRTLAAIRDALLPKLLSGEVRVREAERLVEAVV